MSWKLFGQIALLIVVGALIMCLVKCGTRSMCKGMYGKSKCVKCMKGSAGM